MEKDLPSYVEIFTNIYRSKDKPFHDTDFAYHEFRDAEIKVCSLYVYVLIDQARALTDLHFLLSNISPLTTVYRASGEDEDGDEQSYKNSSGNIGW